MPVEIKELVIRAVVTPEPDTNNNERSSPEERQDAIVEVCVRQVLKILRRMKER